MMKTRPETCLMVYNITHNKLWIINLDRTDDGSADFGDEGSSTIHEDTLGTGKSLHSMLPQHNLLVWPKRLTTGWELYKIELAISSRGRGGHKMCYLCSTHPYIQPVHGRCWPEWPVEILLSVWSFTKKVPFWFLLDVSIINALVFERLSPHQPSSRHHCSLLQFKLDLAKQLIGGFCGRKRYPGKMYPMAMALPNLPGHQEVKFAGWKRACLNCSNDGSKTPSGRTPETTFGCNWCGVICVGVAAFCSTIQRTAMYDIRFILHTIHIYKFAVYTI